VYDLDGVKFLIASLLVIIAICSAEVPPACRNAFDSFTATASLSIFDSDCINIWEGLSIAMETRSQKERVDVIGMHAGMRFNLSIWSFYTQQVQYILNRDTQTCQKSASGPFPSPNFPPNATVERRTLIGNERCLVIGFGSGSIREQVIVTDEGCIPIRVDVFNTTAQTLSLTENVSDFVPSVDQAVFDLPAACKQAKTVRSAPVKYYKPFWG